MLRRDACLVFRLENLRRISDYKPSTLIHIPQQVYKALISAALRQQGSRLVDECNHIVSDLRRQVQSMKDALKKNVRRTTANNILADSTAISAFDVSI